MFLKVKIATQCDCYYHLWIDVVMMFLTSLGWTSSYLSLLTLVWMKLQFIGGERECDKVKTYFVDRLCFLMVSKRGLNLIEEERSVLFVGTRSSTRWQQQQQQTTRSGILMMTGSWIEEIRGKKRAIMFDWWWFILIIKHINWTDIITKEQFRN